MTDVIVMGLALLIGGSMYATAWIAFAIVGRNPTGAAFLPINLLVIAGSIGIAAGLPGLHALQQHKVGAVGTAATAMLFVGFLLAGVFPPWTGVTLVAAAVAGAIAAYVPIPTALHLAISALGGVVLAVLGLLVVIASQP